MKEIFMNAVKCAYSADLQDSILECTGVSCNTLTDHYFHSREYSVFSPAFAIIKKSLNIKSSIRDGSDVYHIDAYGRRYEEGILMDVFLVKHNEEWYDKLWSCVVEGKDGVEALIEEAIKDYEAYEEKFEKIKEMILQF